VLVLTVAAPASAATFAESGDAGGTRATADVPNVSPLTSITGSVDPESDRDLYKICLSGGQFTAETSTGSDPILELFLEQGTRVALDDDSGPELESRITGVFPAGTYYLAIASFPNVSVDADTPSGFPGRYTFAYTINLTGAEPCDSDNDGVLDGADACAGTASATRVAADGCPDPDGDDVSTEAGDNCPSDANPGQLDSDGDREGDACDADDDNDGVLDGADACRIETGGAQNGCPLPTDKDQCKNGGWMSYGTTFKNQGDCVSFVATRGKNPPGS
jgi:hypothetical protein